jgi:hypothetical protein
MINFEVLEQPSDDEMCKYGGGIEVDIFYSEESISSVTKSENEEIDEELVGDARAKRLGLEQ